MKETRREATAVWTSTAASQPAPASRLLYLLLLHSSWNSLVSPRIYTDYAQRERKRLRISFSGCSVAVETKLFSSFVPSFLSLHDEKREPSVGSSTTALPRTREKNIRVDPWTRTSRSRGTRESRTDVKISSKFWKTLDCEDAKSSKKCERREKERKREKTKRKINIVSRDLRMFRATCGKKGKVDFWVMRACEAITRVVEEAGYWSLRDTRDKTGEGRKK